MNERPSLARMVRVAVGVLMAGAMMTSCTQIVTVPILVGDGFTIFNKEGLVPGEQIPQDFEDFPLPLCGVLPARSDLQGLVAQGILSPLAGLIEITAVQIRDTTVTATGAQGSFDDFTRLELLWQPGEVNGVTQPAVSLGVATSAGGLASPLTLYPPVPVDFLALADAGTVSCPSLETKVAGRVPGTMPEWSIRIRLSITARIGF